MRVPEDVLGSAMRFSLSHLLTEEQMMEAGRRIVEAVQRLRHGSIQPYSGNPV
jgi:cysteine sulfinate desulfinase/cysteine desulfurase-like protein